MIASSARRSINTIPTMRSVRINISHDAMNQRRGQQQTQTKEQQTKEQTGINFFRYGMNVNTDSRVEVDREESRERLRKKIAESQSRRVRIFNLSSLN